MSVTRLQTQLFLSVYICTVYATAGTDSISFSYPTSLINIVSTLLLLIVFLNFCNTTMITRYITVLFYCLFCFTALPYCNKFNFLIRFYRWMLCIRGTSHGHVSVRLSVRLSVTSRCSTKTAKRRITKQHYTIPQGV